MNSSYKYLGAFAAMLALAGPALASNANHLVKDIAHDQARIAKIQAKIVAKPSSAARWAPILASEQSDLAGDLASLSSSSN